MKRFAIALFVCCLLVGATSAWSDSDNLLVNGNFATDLSGWTVQGAVVYDYNDGVPPGSAVVPRHAWGLLSQVVEANWNPNLTHTEFELSAQVRIIPTEDIHFKVGYWYDTENAPAPGSTPDVILDLFSTDNTGQCWRTYTHKETLDTQPRWFEVRIEWNPELNPEADCHGWVDQVFFSADCIPEPSGIAALLTSFGALAGFCLRRKS